MKQAFILRYLISYMCNSFRCFIFFLRAIRHLFYDDIGRKGIMRHITISALSLFIVLPAVANARLPVVNISSGSVSARSAFGEESAEPDET